MAGLVSFEEKSQIISVKMGAQGPPSYDIPLEGIDSAKELLDWILQLNYKTWCTGQHLKEFLDLVPQVAEKNFGQNAQAVFCSQTRRNDDITWPETKKESHKVE